MLESLLSVRYIEEIRWDSENLKIEADNKFSPNEVNKIISETIKNVKEII